jgi:hypothetical protein
MVVKLLVFHQGRTVHQSFDCAFSKICVECPENWLDLQEITNQRR